MHFVTSYIFFICLVRYCSNLPVESIRPTEIGLEENVNMISNRERFEVALAENPPNSSFFTLDFDIDHSNFSLSVSKDDLKLGYDHSVQLVIFNVTYNSHTPTVLSYALDSTTVCELMNASWYWLPSKQNGTLAIPVYLRSKQMGISYLLVWVRRAKELGYDQPVSWNLSSKNYFDVVDASVDNEANGGFPVRILRQTGVVQIVFRVFVILMVTVFTFTMGCELDPKLLKQHSRKPVGPAIGFCCQFVLMPLIAFSVAKLISIKQEFRFGLLVTGCSPGGGASNAWSLLLGGDINLSILMTFVSSLSALFMMPLLLFALGRFFIDVNLVKIPYLNITAQLLQITTPAVLGLGLRCWKPKIACKMAKLTRPLFLFFILFFLTFGVYANWSILSLLGTYPIVIPTSALLPWIGFCTAALAAFLLCQPRPVVITIALETGIQNVGAAILVLLYSMPQPTGDLGAIMPISVSLFTPLPLTFILLGMFIKRKCCRSKKDITIAIMVNEADQEQTYHLKGSDLDRVEPDIDTPNNTELPNRGVGDCRSTTRL